MIKLITFDIGGTIIKHKKEESKLDKIENLIDCPRNVFKDEYKKIFCTSKVPLNEMIDMFSKTYPISNKEKFKEIFKKESNIIPQDVFEKIFYELNNFGYKVATLSNACYWTYTPLTESILKEYIDKEFYSFDVGYTKPNSNIFKYVEQYYQIKSNEILHIGNSYVSDYLGAKECGWNSYLYKENKDIEAFINNLKGGHLNEKS